MAHSLKPIDRQTIVLTGATSGIGLATARMLAERGACLVLAARNGEDLERLSGELTTRGVQVETVAVDLGASGGAATIADVAKERFGGFDTWINNAAVAIYGAIEDVSEEEHRRIFDVNYFALVEGSREAARHLKRKGGKIINLGSVLSDRAIIYQGPYSATKHAVKAFTDALRMELAAAGASVSVTLIKPGAIDTPYMEHARSHFDSAGTRNPPPSYDPSVVAKAITFACTHHRRTLAVGFGGYSIGLLGAHFPRLTDRLMEAVGGPIQQSRHAAAPEARDNLFDLKADGSERSNAPTTLPRQSSLFLEAQMHPRSAALFAVCAGVLAINALTSRHHRTIRRSRDWF